MAHMITFYNMGVGPRPNWFQDRVSKNEIITMNEPEDRARGGFGFRKTRCRIKTPVGWRDVDCGDCVFLDSDGAIWTSGMERERLRWENPKSIINDGPTARFKILVILQAFVVFSLIVLGHGMMIANMGWTAWSGYALTLLANLWVAFLSRAINKAEGKNKMTMDRLERRITDLTKMMQEYTKVD